jgi:hypothetical protein
MAGSFDDSESDDELRAEKCWHWTDNRCQLAPSGPVPRLNREFVADRAAGVAAILNDAGYSLRLCFGSVLVLMGATDEEILTIGLRDVLDGLHRGASRGLLDLKGVPKESPLRKLGYRVGKDGEPTTKRREILRKAFEGPLPNVGNAQYMATWGDPKTWKRETRIWANIRQYCANENKKQNGSKDAIKDWEEDLEWFAGYVRDFFRKNGFPPA